MYAGGYSAISGPRIAKMLIKQTAIDMGTWEGTNGVNAGLIGEIHRLTNVVAPNGKGWGATPYEDALNQNIFDKDDRRIYDDWINSTAPLPVSKYSSDWVDF